MVMLYKKIKLLKGLFTGEVAQTGPFYVTVDLTRRCNLKCTGCRYHSHKVNDPSPGDQTMLDLSLNLFNTDFHRLSYSHNNTLIMSLKNLMRH